MLKRILLLIMLFPACELYAGDVYLFKTVKFPRADNSHNGDQPYLEFLKNNYPQAFDSMHNIKSYRLTNTSINKNFTPHLRDHVIVLKRQGVHVIKTVRGFYTDENVSGCKEHIFIEFDGDVKHDRAAAFIPIADTMQIDKFFHWPKERILIIDEIRDYSSKTAQQIRMFIKQDRYPRYIGDSLEYNGAGDYFWRSYGFADSMSRKNAGITRVLLKEYKYAAHEYNNNADTVVFIQYKAKNEKYGNELLVVKYKNNVRVLLASSFGCLFALRDTLYLQYNAWVPGTGMAGKELFRLNNGEMKHCESDWSFSD